MQSILTLLFICISFSLKAQLFGLIPINSFKEGYYYNLKGEKILGKIAKDASAKNIFRKGNYFLFKPADGGDRERIYPQLISCFVVGKDSLTVSHGEKANFYNVILDTEVKLYNQMSFATSGGGMAMSANGGFYGGGAATRKVYTYYFGPDADHLQELTKKNFLASMVEILKERPDLADKVAKKKYKFRHIEDIVDAYKGNLN
ncbi:hypothetical protein ACVWYN_003656 [Pedobacter sp. UYP24]